MEIIINTDEGDIIIRPSWSSIVPVYIYFKKKGTEDKDVMRLGRTELNELKKFAKAIEGI